MSATDAAMAKPKYDPNFTDSVIAATGPNANPRLKQIMPSLVRHLHDFAREVDLTVSEWMAGVEMTRQNLFFPQINEAGRMSTDRRNETQLLCDVLGLESLVDEITSKLLLRRGNSSSSNNHPSAPAPTPSAILGPFYRADAPILPNGSSIVSAAAPWSASSSAALLARVSGRVLSASPSPPFSSSCPTAPATPIAGATVDVWLAGPNGLYEQQDAGQPDMNLRGRFRTDARGRYALRCLRPTAYPIPDDGPAGRLLALLDRHPFRPAHIHFIVSAPGRRTLVTQVFDAEDERVMVGEGGGEGGGDAVFAVKRELIVRFRERDGEKKDGEDGDGDGEEEGEGQKVRWELEYDFYLGEE
ncbi:Intradiol ring-cleavage dioxygenase [Biscogniauxia mediterranea]|nr:Intradiol ring-cleavage dioxygenase [Biscogniauxia mediterranea]